MEHPRCPFYPDACVVERHPNMQHRWRSTTATEVAKEVVRPTLHVKKHGLNYDPPANVALPTVTNADGITNKERQAKWREKNREKHRQLERDRLREKRAKGVS